MTSWVDLVQPSHDVVSYNGLPQPELATRIHPQDPSGRLTFLEARALLDNQLSEPSKKLGGLGHLTLLFLSGNQLTGLRCPTAW